MKKRIICLLLCAVMLLPSLTAPVSAATAEQTPAGEASNYLRLGDYFVISPAEKWQAFGSEMKRVAVATTEWELTAQHSGTANGNDIQTWKYGVSDKFYVAEVDARKSAIAGFFRIRNKGFRESDDGRYWDIKNRSTDTGGNVHVWDYKDADSQWFYLEEDGDGDPETFFLKNKNSDLYIVPRHYFKDPKNDCGPGKTSWSEEGCNMEQSEFPFRWRIQVLNRDAANDMGKTDKYANWMSLLPDDRYLSELNIPGTHDSATTNVEGSWNASDNNVACQKYFIEQQLYAGVRALDLRTGWHGGDMLMVHGDFICHTPDHKNNSQNKTFRSVLDTIIRYLDKHKTETVIVTLKIDSGDKEKGRLELAEMLNEYIGEHRDYFYCWTSELSKTTFKDAQSQMTSPTLGQARGKIVLMTRVNMSMSEAGKSLLYNYTGPDLTQWDDSYNDRNHYAQKIKSESTVSVYIQDDYSSSDGNKKEQVFNTIHQLNGHLDQGDSIRPQDFAFNYTSKIAGDHYGCTPLGAAKYMNDLIYNNDLFTPGSKEAKENPRLGIMVMDYVNKQLCRRIIDRNAFPSSAAMKYETVTANGETQTVEQTPFLSAFAEMPLSDGLTAPDVPTENVTAPSPAEAKEIVWPEKAELTYGYVLGEAALHFADNASGGKEGRFEFENAAEILPATKDGETPETRTLKFLPADGTAVETKEIPVTVHRRYLPIKISHYEVEYGDPFSREALTRDVTVTAGGYLLPEHLAHLNAFIQKYDIRWLLRDSKGNEIKWPDVPATNELASGTIDLAADVKINPESEFPNYNARVERGVWKIVPRTVTVSWRWDNGAWRAELGNILPGDDVAPVLTNGTLTLTGKQAAYYQVADEDQTAPPIPFADVSADDYYYDAVLWAVRRGITAGTDAAHFSPSADCARSQLVTFLWRAAGKPKAEQAEQAAHFSDVAADAYYAEAVRWAASLGIVTGYSDDCFGADDPITREQMAVMLYRFAKALGIETAQSGAPAQGFDDFEQVSAYAEEAVTWAANAAILRGADNRLMPQAPCTRAQIVTMLNRLLGE